MPEIIYRKLKDLKLLEGNPRQIDKPEFAILCQSIEANPDYFEARPLILSDRTGDLVILAGNMRYRAAKHLKQKEVPTILLSGLTEQREREIIIRDNVNNGAWDYDLIANEWSDEPLSDWGLDVPGFEAVEEVGEADAEPQIDKAAELNKKWKVKSGDLWQIGEHRLICGDSTNAETVEMLLDGAKPNLMITDPPYGVEYDAAWREEAGIEGCANNSIGKVKNDDRIDWSAAYELFPGKVFYCWHAGRHSGEVQASIEISGFKIRSQIVWVKEQGVISRGHYNWQHEPCWYAFRTGETANWIGDLTQTTVWRINKANRSDTGHSTQKPLECMARPIRNHEGDVYEPFAGSGTTLVACQNLNRKCYAIEISENYCAVILERMATAFPDIEIKRIDG